MLRIRKIANFQERFVSKSLQNSSFFQVAVSCIFLQEPQCGKLCGTARFSRSNVLAEQLFCRTTLAGCLRNLAKFYRTRSVWWYVRKKSRSAARYPFIHLPQLGQNLRKFFASESLHTWNRLIVLKTHPNYLKWKVCLKSRAITRDCQASAEASSWTWFSVNIFITYS